MPDFTATGGACGLLGLDAATGRELWRIPLAASEDAVPLRFDHDGQELIISGVAGVQKDEPGRIVCVEPRGGDGVYCYDLRKP